MIIGSKVMKANDCGAGNATFIDFCTGIENLAIMKPLSNRFCEKRVLYP